MQRRDAVFVILAVMLALEGSIALPLAAQAQSAPTPRAKVDVRTMAPGPLSPEVVAPAASASGLTRDQRKEATLQARQDGSLKPAGEAADPIGTAAARQSAPATVAAAPPASPVPPAASPQTSRSLTATSSASSVPSAVHSRGKSSVARKAAVHHPRATTGTKSKAPPQVSSRPASAAG